MNNKELQDRITRLEEAISLMGKPYSDYTCECCECLYIPSCYDSVRCVMCCQTCYYDKISEKWFQGSLCPSRRSYV